MRIRKQNWKEYIIAVHGIKGAMASIGANGVSELAKQLEFAGKENRIHFIEENHAGLMVAYETFFENLVKNQDLCPSKEDAEETLQDAKELSEGDFDKIISGMESSVYAFDTDGLIKYLEEREQYSYKGKVLKSILAPVRRKIEMMDYFSAVELLANLKKDMD